MHRPVLHTWNSGAMDIFKSLNTYARCRWKSILNTNRPYSKTQPHSRLQDGWSSEQVVAYLSTEDVQSCAKAGHFIGISHPPECAPLSEWVLRRLAEWGNPHNSHKIQLRPCPLRPLANICWPNNINSPISVRSLGSHQPSEIRACRGNKNTQLDGEMCSFLERAGV